MSKATDSEPRPVNVAVLTVSDTRTLDDDTSGQFLVDALAECGHHCADRAIVVDDIPVGSRTHKNVRDRRVAMD